jgi:hypothetical protein
MKKMAWFISGLILISLACRTLQSIQPTATATQLPAVKQSPTVMQIVASPSATEAIPTSTPRPTPQPIICKDDSCLDACLARIEKAIPQSSPYEPLSGVYGGDNIDLNLVYYDVENGQLGEPEFLYVPDEFKELQQDINTHQNVWLYASGLLPPDKVKWLTGFEIFSSSYYAAWVSPGGSDQSDRSHWILGMDIADAQNPVDLTYILVHEYGHLVTLNTDQIPVSDYYYGWYQNPAFCTQFLSPDGCSQPDSYINLFYQKFWKNIFEEWQNEVEMPKVNTPEEFYALVDKFYEKYSEQFVRDYAATNIFEDLAESFEYFVLEPKPNDKNIIAQKIRFFYDFPELVSLRQQMIQSICSYTQ